MKRYQRFVLEAEEGISFVIVEGKDKELIIKAVRLEKENSFYENISQMVKEEDIKKNVVLENLPENVPKEIAQEEVKDSKSQERLLKVSEDKEEKQEDVKKEERTEIETLEQAVEDVKEKTSSGEKEEYYEDYSDNYNAPPIPNGFEYFEGTWNDGYVIRRIEDLSEFVWVPVGVLEANGTFDGKTFDEKFGRRNYKNDVFSDEQYNEKLEGDLLKQLQSVKKYGGFYISRYDISKNNDGKIVSVKNALPYVNLSYDNALKLASQMISDKEVQSHITYGAEYDSVLEWIISSKSKSIEEVVDTSVEWGNSYNLKNSIKGLAKTGSNEQWKVLNIYDFAGNVREFTQEKFEKSYCVMRGGGFNNISCSVANRQKNYHTLFYRDVGFRVVLYLK